MSYKTYFDKIDEELLKISPRQDIMLLRVIAAVIPVVFFGLDAIYDLPALYWLGMPFYLFCLALYLEGLLKSLLLLHKVSAELLIVLVMTVTLIDGAPLSGAMVAWFIGFGLYISFTIIRKNREKIESLIQEGTKTAQVLRGDDIEELPINQIRQDDVVLIPKGAMVPIDGTIIVCVSAFFYHGQPASDGNGAGGSLSLRLGAGDSNRVRRQYRPPGPDQYSGPWRRAPGKHAGHQNPDSG